VISILVAVVASVTVTTAAEANGEHLIAHMGSLEEECLGALGGLARLDLLDKQGGGALVINS